MWMDRFGVLTLGRVVLQTALVLSLLIGMAVSVSLSPSEADAMQQVKKSLNFASSSLKWTDADPCNWQQVQCKGGQVTNIQIGTQRVSGTLSPAIANLTNLEVLELMNNDMKGPLPSLKGLASLQMLNIHDNQFDAIPPDFFDGMQALSKIYLDNNPFNPWSLPDGLQALFSLTEFSANSVNLVGRIPDFFNSSTFPSLQKLHMSGNALQGPLPAGFSDLQGLQSLWLNGQKNSSGAPTLTGTIEVLQKMTGLSQIWLHGNGFTGPIPDLSGLSALQNLSLRDNSLTGPVPPSLMKMGNLVIVNITNNDLQGPTPKFAPTVTSDISVGKNSFCLGDPGVACDSRVTALISTMEPFGYPVNIAEGWNGNDPCSNFVGITCSKGNISVINLQNKGLSGTLSPNFACLTSVQVLNLAHNNIIGTIPDALATMPSLTTLDLSFNHLDVSKRPSFRTGIAVNVDSNTVISQAPPPGRSSSGKSGASSEKGSRTGVLVAVIVSVCVVLAVGLLIFCFMKRKRFYRRVQSDTVVLHPNHPESDCAFKITVTGVNGNATSDGHSQGTSGSSDVHVIETNNMVISIQVLRSVTNNFSDDKILGKGGFGTVYEGELPDGTKIAVKRMNSGVLGDKGLAEFKSEIAVLTKVRHRHLVGLLGFCVDGIEKLLVYEYLPQGALSKFLFSWKDEGLKPLEWKQRLTISLDVARGVEYLHGLAHQSFIHRDLKPSNILLGDDMRAKVADFGLVRLAPDGGNISIETRLAGTFGYLAPEYAVMGRITTKVDVFSFGVILMEMITGRKALDESQPEDSVHLVTWFRRMYISKDTFQKAIDPTIDLDEETLASVYTVVELAGHCCAREPNQRPEMCHVVNVISSLAHKWKPAEDNSEDDVFGIDFDMSLPQALKKWQALEDSTIDSSSSTSFFASGENTQTSLPTRPSGFADSFTSSDGR